MKSLMLIAAVATVGAAAIGGCATAASVAADPAFDPAATTFTGWVKVTGEEFELYSEQRDLTQPFVRPCVSGALPANAQRAAGDLTGSQVTFTGKAVAWAGRDGSQTLNHQGSFIHNQCRGDYVIAADSVRVLR